MSTTNTSTINPQIATEDSDLIETLHELSIKSPKLVKSTIYAAPGDPSIDIRSWKMNEFKYYDIPSPFPTLARGLFSRKTADDEKHRKSAMSYRIVARGYDKFFNVGEVPWTTWAWLEEHTAAPYTLSLKSNGCIIFISALNPTKLLITSKHSLGPIQNLPLSHAQAGEVWLRKYLDGAGKAEEEFAAELWENNWTAVAELCDDSFEEHVLGYPPEKTGLHLHGLNVRSKAFNTMATDVVDAFAEKWGFIKTPTKLLHSIREVKAFSDACAVRGQWEGEPVEGFVVRTHVANPPNSGRSNGSPYKSGSPLFFKIKFDEPYMMYRDWREVTKMLLSAKGPMNSSTLPKSKLKRPETKAYVNWVINEIETNPSAFEDYNKGKGIIATREKFLVWLKSEKGEDDLESMKQGDGGISTTCDAREFGKTVIVPVAIPGCGKTSVSVALSHIFGFGHTQSDDVHAKKSAPAFVKNVVKMLQSHDVIIADKNNHLKQHRQQLRDATVTMSPPVRLLALNWGLDGPPAMIHRICSDRVLHRGDNHQTLRADISTAKFHEEVIWSFISDTQGLAAAEVDAIVEMEIQENFRQAVERAVKGVAKILGLELPSEERVTEALHAIEGYVPATKKRDEQRKKTGAPRYYALLPEMDLFDILEERLCGSEVDGEIRDAWIALKEGGRVLERPHVTIIHKNNINSEADLWNRCVALHAQMNPPSFTGNLGKVMWNGRVMAITVENFGIDADEADGNQKGADFVKRIPLDVRERLHITVGTKSRDIPPVEAKSMIESWNDGSKDGVKIFELGGVVVKGRIKGLFA